MAFQLGPLGTVEYGTTCNHCGVVTVVNGEALHKATCREPGSPLDHLKEQLKGHGFADHDFDDGGLFEGMSAADLTEVLSKVVADNQKIMR